MMSIGRALRSWSHDRLAPSCCFGQAHLGTSTPSIILLLAKLCSNLIAIVHEWFYLTKLCTFVFANYDTIAPYRPDHMVSNRLLSSYLYMSCVSHYLSLTQLLVSFKPVVAPASVMSTCRTHSPLFQYYAPCTIIVAHD